MPLYKELPMDVMEVDVIVIGGGTAGCIVASRLSDADPNLSVLVIEKGENNYNVPGVTTPAFAFSNISPGKTVTIHAARKEEALANRQLSLLAGAMLGGGSSINFMVYARAQRSDFDSWNTPGWSAEDVLPYMRKLETYHGPGPRDTHGHDGPIHVSEGRFSVKKSQDDFTAAAEKLGLPEKDDLMDLDSNNGVQRALRYVSPQGKRQDVAHAYLHPRLLDGKHANLHVLVESEVARVIFDGNRATGVEYVQKKADSESNPRGYPRTVRARRLVIASAGAAATPTLLERSGVGNREILERAGVDMVAHIPGVGDGYTDHQLLASSYRTNLGPEETLDALSRGELGREEMLKNDDGILSWNAVSMIAKVRPTGSEVTALGPEFEKVYDRDFKDNLNKPLCLFTMLNRYHSHLDEVPVGQYMTISAVTAYPYSRGRLHITGNELGDPVDFVTGFFTDAGDVDLKKCMWAYKKMREIARRMDTYRGEVARTHPPFPPSSQAACVEIGSPLGRDIADIRYTPEDDRILAQWIRENIVTAWHPLGTCKMAPLDEMGVVDARLGVHGVENLKVVDLSIAPLNVAANTRNTAMVIGEKAADMFTSELRLVEVRPS
ncbi:alcohol oxidase-like protein [Xylariaceae sp. FL0594]|nr:alcohol oxidase-like protein [Xylariaceae sp. FL0594]